MYTIPTITKNSGEERVLTMSFGARLRPGDTISGIVGAPVVVPADPSIVITNVAFNSTSVSAKYAGGTDDTKRMIEITVTTALGDKIVGQGWLRVENTD